MSVIFLKTYLFVAGGVLPFNDTLHGDVVKALKGISSHRVRHVMRGRDENS
jgi:hypothetical protein